MTERIPDHLLTFDEKHWLPHVEDSCRIPILRARELWRQAQDRWGHQHGIWRAEFERLQRQQLTDTNGEDTDAGPLSAA